MLKKFWKSVKIWQSYGHEFLAYFFWLTLYILHRHSRFSDSVSKHIPYDVLTANLEIRIDLIDCLIRRARRIFDYDACWLFVQTGDWVVVYFPRSYPGIVAWLLTGILMYVISVNKSQKFLLNALVDFFIFFSTTTTQGIWVIRLRRRVDVFSTSSYIDEAERSIETRAVAAW